MNGYEIWYKGQFVGLIFKVANTTWTVPHWVAQNAFGTDVWEADNPGICAHKLGEWFLDAIRNW